MKELKRARKQKVVGFEMTFRIERALYALKEYLDRCGDELYENAGYCIVGTRADSHAVSDAMPLLLDGLFNILREGKRIEKESARAPREAPEDREPRTVDGGSL